MPLMFLSTLFSTFFFTLVKVDKTQVMRLFAVLHQISGTCLEDHRQTFLTQTYISDRNGSLLKKKRKVSSGLQACHINYIINLLYNIWTISFADLDIALFVYMRVCLHKNEC